MASGVQAFFIHRIDGACAAGGGDGIFGGRRISMGIAADSYFVFVAFSRGD
jgi:hypothetical protein